MDTYLEDFCYLPPKKEIGGSPRKLKILERSEISSTDPENLKEHDEFYKAHKLLLLLFVLMGVMPNQRNNQGKIVFRWYSGATIYAACFYVVTSIFVITIGIERFDILWKTSRRFDEYIYSVIFVVFLIPHFWIPFVGWGAAKEVAVYKSAWGPFEIHYYQITGEKLQFPHLKTLIIVISISCLIVAVVFLITLSLLLTDFTLWHTTAYYHIIVMINMDAALWYINCRAVSQASLSIATSFQKDVVENCTDYIIARYRLLWLELSNIIQLLGNSNTRTYSAYCLFMFVNITIAIYGLMSKVIDDGLQFGYKELGLFVDCVYCATLLFIFCDFSHHTTINISQRVQNTLTAIDLTTVDKITIREIEIFLTAIQLNPPIVSLKGYTNVNRELLTSMITTISVYLTVLLQFKLSLQKDNFLTKKITQLSSDLN